MTHHITDEQIATLHDSMFPAPYDGYGSVIRFARAVLALAAPQAVPMTDTERADMICAVAAICTGTSSRNLAETAIEWTERRYGITALAAPAPAVPSGWSITDNGDNSITVHGPGLGCTVSDVEEVARRVPSEVLYEFCRAMLTAAPTPPAQPASAPAAMNADLMQEAKTAIELAMDNLRSHGDNCFLHDDGEYDACFCGLDSLSDYLQSTVEAIEGAISAPAAEQPAVPEDVARIKAAMSIAMDALDEIALAGMSGTGQESEKAMRDWHARRAWEFIGIAAHARNAARAAEKGGA